MRDLRTTPISHQVTDGCKVNRSQQEAVWCNRSGRRNVANRQKKDRGDDSHLQARTVTGTKGGHQNYEEKEEEKKAVGSTTQRDKHEVPCNVYPVQRDIIEERSTSEGKNVN